MAAIVYAAPSAPTAPPEGSKWLPLRMTWEGADGSLWQLNDHGQGIFLGANVRGLGMPTYQRWGSSSPAVPGSRHKGSRAEAREIFWPVNLFADSSIEWMEFDRAFWRSLDPDISGVWTVFHPDGPKRTLRCRFAEAEEGFPLDPIANGWATYGVRLEASSPYWEGEPVARSWKQDPARNFLVTPEDRAQFSDPEGTILCLATGSALGSATFTNDGDVPAYPVWTVAGPTTAVSVGVEGKTITIPFEIPEGKAVKIDTTPGPGGQRLWFGDWVYDEAARRWDVINLIERTGELFAHQKFAPIPAGQSRKLSLTMTGTGLVRAEITPRYRRAW